MGVKMRRNIKRKKLKGLLKSPSRGEWATRAELGEFVRWTLGLRVAARRLSVG